MTAVAKLVAYWRKRAPDLVPYTVAADQLEAALSPAELGGVERDVQRALRALTEHEWISEDGCASLAANDIANTIRKLSTPRAAEAVTEEMVDRAFEAFHLAPLYRSERERIRATLEYALTPPSAKGE